MKNLAILSLAALLLVPVADAQWAMPDPPVTASWTSSTALNTRLTVNVKSFSTAAITLDATSTITGGSIIFELSKDNGATYPYKVSCVRTDSPASENSFALAVTSQAWQCPVAGFTQLGVRLNPAITGTGTVSIWLDKSQAPMQSPSESPTIAKAEDAPHTSGDTGVPVWGVRKDTNTETTSNDGDYAQISTDSYGAIFSRSDHPNRIHCVVPVSTATTIQAVGGSCIAPGSGFSIYITDIEFGTSAAAGTAADSFPTLKSGTGGTCGTGTTVIWQALTTANSTVVSNRTTPIKVASNSEVCWIMTTAGSKILAIDGYIAR